VDPWARASERQIAQLGAADPDDDVRVDGRRIEAEPRSYWLLHKPENVLTTTADPFAAEAGRRTVLELLPAAARRTRLVPVGRLDLNSEGLLLFTNDGDVVQALLHPSHGCEREYQVDVWGELTPATARKLAAGVELEDGRTNPAACGSPNTTPPRPEPSGGGAARGPQAADPAFAARARASCGGCCACAWARSGSATCRAGAHAS
jgi:16S rRNA U516 pseudouridylate synthase RsuA-like enzyme